MNRAHDHLFVTAAGSLGRDAQPAAGRIFFERRAAPPKPKPKPAPPPPPPPSPPRCPAPPRGTSLPPLIGGVEYTGSVLKWFADSGHGFCVPDGRGKSHNGLFFHARCLDGGLDRASLAEGSRVRFTVTADARHAGRMMVERMTLAGD